jgi:hypothetical protein
MHTASPADDLYRPALHAVQSPPWARLYPALQVQFVDAAPENELAPHVEHGADPSEFLKKPTRQATQREPKPSGPDHPALQTQVVLPNVAEGVPIHLHVLQGMFARSILNVPGPQGAQEKPSGPV